jgi:hypothetical protein
MKLVIPIHSFVDLITNSSSELFVCNGDKSVKAVREALIELAELYNTKQALRPPHQQYPLDMDRLFDNVFMEPYISEGDDTNAYGAHVANKGDIIIRTASDNSAPYEMFGDILSIFSASGYHLG